MFVKLTISIFFISHIYYLSSLITSPYPYANLFKIWTVYRENDKQTQKCSHPPKRWYKIDLFLIYHETIILIGTISDVIAGEFPQVYLFRHFPNLVKTFVTQRSTILRLLFNMNINESHLIILCRNSLHYSMFRMSGWSTHCM